MSLCKICGSDSRPFLKSHVLQKYSADYHRCEVCGFTYVDQVNWLEEAYSEAISSTDVGMILRNLECKDLTLHIIKRLKLFDGTFIEYGGGYGILTRLLRDAGVNFFWQDKYCKNLFAKYFEADPKGKYDLATCFEVFEHLVNPQDELNQILGLSDAVLFSTELMKPGMSQVEFRDWDYRAPESGQHISFFTLNSLQKLAAVNNCYFQTDGVRYHLFSKKPIKTKVFRLTLGNSIMTLLLKSLKRLQAGGFKQKSLLSHDFKKAVSHLRE